eukprot:IDg12717t1
MTVVDSGKGCIVVNFNSSSSVTVIWPDPKSTIVDIFCLTAMLILSLLTYLLSAALAEISTPFQAFLLFALPYVGFALHTQNKKEVSEEDGREFSEVHARRIGQQRQYQHSCEACEVHYDYLGIGTDYWTEEL